jgi:hypothetical protein
MSTRWGWFDFLKPSLNQEFNCISPKRAPHCRVNMVAGFVSAFPKLLATDGGRKDVQYVPLFEGGALDIAQGDTIQ